MVCGSGGGGGGCWWLVVVVAVVVVGGGGRLVGVVNTYPHANTYIFSFNAPLTTSHHAIT